MPLVLLAGAARICYGVHRVNQVLVGWRLGIAIAVLAMAAERPLADAASRLGLVFALWHAVAMWSIHQKSPPAEWAERFAEWLVELDEQDEPYSLVAPAPIAKVDLDFWPARLRSTASVMTLRKVSRGTSALGLKRSTHLLWGDADQVVGVLGEQSDGQDVEVHVLLVGRERE